MKIMVKKIEVVRVFYLAQKKKQKQHPISTTISNLLVIKATK